MAAPAQPQQKKTLLMTEGSIWKSILLFSVPLILGNLLQQLYNTADSIIVGNFLGSNALAAVGSSGSPIYLLIGFSQGVAVGAGVVVSQYLGAKDKKETRIAVHTSLAIAAILGLILTVGGIAVMVVMPLYYGLAGLLADVMLVFTITMLMAGLAAFGATLTLPGIAGIVLTIGMSVDANVLIFERIREEIRQGLKPLEAVAVGFDRATISIVDSNLTTIIAAAILYQFGTGPVRGVHVYGHFRLAHGVWALAWWKRREEAQHLAVRLVRIRRWMYLEL